jgi:hypothetical protein
MALLIAGMISWASWRLFVVFARTPRAELEAQYERLHAALQERVNLMAEHELAREALTYAQARVRFFRRLDRAYGGQGDDKKRMYRHEARARAFEESLRDDITPAWYTWLPARIEQHNRQVSWHGASTRSALTLPETLEPEWVVVNARLFPDNDGYEFEEEVFATSDLRAQDVECEVDVAETRRTVCR